MDWEPLPDPLEGVGKRLRSLAARLDKASPALYLPGDAARILAALEALESEVFRFDQSLGEIAFPSALDAELDELFDAARLALIAEGKRRQGAVAVSKRAAQIAKDRGQLDLIAVATIDRVRAWLKSRGH